MPWWQGPTERGKSWSVLAMLLCVFMRSLRTCAGF